MNSSGSEDTLITRLFALPAAERAAYWQRTCAEHPGLRARAGEIANLLATTSPDPGGQLDLTSPAPLPPVLAADTMARALESALSPADQEATGAHIGRYKLLQKIGEGGFGTVWMAEQQEPIRRRVALKIIKAGMDTEEVIARFEVERQALALMDHVNIARVFDAGATATGRPFFVMELVRGVPITRYCDDNRLTAAERLRLFIAVCQAVQHAHQKGVIHRDLKPSNVLVTLHDGVPVPKIIDFGIAKATDQPLTDKTLVTQFHAFVGTPAYTSPEQMEMSGLDIDTRSDIYSLGVLLYELLAGRPPFDPDALRKSGLEAMRRTIRETDPPRPSHRLDTLTDTDRTSVALARRTDAAKLSLLLRGDVDWIVMHCLEKDRTRRYETANALARDVERHLANEPVAARPPSTLYRAQKLFRRHKFAVTAAAAVAVSLVGGLAFSTLFLIRERAARKRAVAAEQSEAMLRHNAEAAQAVEARRASRTSLALAEQLLREDGHTAEGLAHLVRAARSDPLNSAVGSRLVSALAYHSFPAPIGEALMHPAPVRAAYYSADGRRCVTQAEDTVLRYWDLESGRVLRTVEVGEISLCEPSPDRRSIATAATDGGVRIWDLETGKVVVGPLKNEPRIAALAFSDDGRRLAVGSSTQTTKIWRADTGELLTTLHHTSTVNGVAFSPDGSSVITTTYHGPWRIWNVIDGRPLTRENRQEATSTSGPTGARFSPDGRVVIVYGNTTVQRPFGAQMFDAATGAPVGARMISGDAPSRATFSHDGKKVAIAAADGTARIWSVPSGEPLSLPLKHGGSPMPLDFSTDDRYLATGSYDGLARIWDVRTGRLALEPVRVGDITSVNVAPDGREFLTSGRDGAVRRWQMGSSVVTPLRLPSPLDVHRDPSNPSEVWLLHRDRIEKIDVRTGRETAPARRLPVPVFGGYFIHDGLRALLGTEEGPELWDLRAPEIVRHPLGRHLLLLYAPIISDDGSRIAIEESQGAFAVRVWDGNTGALLAGPITNAGRNFGLSADGKRLAVSTTENSVSIWDVATRELVGAPLHHSSRVGNVQFSPDGRLLATMSDPGGVQIWDVQSGRPIGPPVRQRTFTRNAVFSRNGRRLLTWTPLEARVWNLATARPLTEPMASENVVRAIFNDDESRVVTMTSAGEGRIWDSATGQMLADPILIRNRVTLAGYFDFLSGGGILAVGLNTSARANGFSFWPVPPPADGKPIPDWLLRLATATAGGEVDASAVFRVQAIDAKAFDDLRRELASLPDTAPYTVWGRWLLADRSLRSIGPGFTILPAEAEKLAASATVRP